MVSLHSEQKTHDSVTHVTKNLIKYSLRSGSDNWQSTTTQHLILRRRAANAVKLHMLFVACASAAPYKQHTPVFLCYYNLVQLQGTRSRAFVSLARCGKFSCVFCTGQHILLHILVLYAMFACSQGINAAVRIGRTRALTLASSRNEFPNSRRQRPRCRQMRA